MGTSLPHLVLISHWDQISSYCVRGKESRTHPNPLTRRVLGQKPVCAVEKEEAE